MYHTYIIKSISTSKIYIGQSSDLPKRIARHNSGGSNYTRNKGPWELVYSFEFSSRSEAMLLENKLKAFKNSKKVLDWAKSQ